MDVHDDCVDRKPIVMGVDIIQAYDIQYYTVFALELLLYIQVYAASYVALTNQTHLHRSLEEL